MWREWFVQWFFFPGVKQKTKKRACFLKDWAGIGNRIFLAFSIGLSRLFSYSKNWRAWYTDLRTPQASWHSTGVIAFTTEIIALQSGPRHIFVASNRCFFLIAEIAWNHVFLEYGEDGVPTWNFWSFTYDRIPCKSGILELTEDIFYVFFSSTRARSAGPIVKLFLVCENNFEWCRVHWEGVKGTHILIFCTENWCTSGMSSYSTLKKQSTFLGVFWLKVGVISKLCSKKGFFWGRNMCRRQCMCQQKTALG